MYLLCAVDVHLVSIVPIQHVDFLCEHLQKEFLWKLTFKAGNLLVGEAPAGEAQRVPVGVPLGLLHVQAHLGASCYCAPCVACHKIMRRACCPGPTQLDWNGYTGMFLLCPCIS